MKTIVLGGGCFWCIEAVFQRVKDVKKVVSGYAGGSTLDPDYYNHDDHAEVIEVTYDESAIDLEILLDIYFNSHDPTTDNQPGTADSGSEYRPIILASDKVDLEIARKIRDWNQKHWDKPIITEINLLDVFYKAEDYHQDYFNKNPGNPYCQVIINPKIAKFEEKFKQYLKD